MVKFQPFYHSDLDTKHRFRDLARRHFDRANSDEVEGEDSVAFALSSALLYMNQADYLAQWFARSMQEVVNVGIEQYYYKQLSIRPEKTKDIPISEAIKIIKGFEFASRDELLEILSRVNKSRNKIAHTILKTTPDKLEDIDIAVRDLRDDTEELMSFTDKFKNGMPPRSLQDEA